MTNNENIDMLKTLNQLGFLVLDDDSIKYMLDNNITPADIGLGEVVEKERYKPKIDRWTLP
tara:strand:+ start:2430 stop:2612 length:183 start_codon:yes stop_codon:yes gene_type:complete